MSIMKSLFKSSDSQQKGITFIEVGMVVVIGALLIVGVLRSSQIVSRLVRDKQRGDDLRNIALEFVTYIAHESKSSKAGSVITPEDLDDLPADVINRSLSKFAWNEDFINPEGAISGSNVRLVPNSSTKGKFNLMRNGQGFGW